MAIVISLIPAALTKVLRATNFLLPNWGWLLVLLVATPALITILFWKEWSVYALIVATIIGLGVLAKFIAKQKTRTAEGAGADCDAHLLQYVVLGLRTTGR